MKLKIKSMEIAGDSLKLGLKGTLKIRVILIGGGVSLDVYVYPGTHPRTYYIDHRSVQIEPSAFLNKVQLNLDEDSRNFLSNYNWINDDDFRSSSNCG